MNVISPLLSCTLYYACLLLSLIHSLHVRLLHFSSLEHHEKSFSTSLHLNTTKRALFDPTISRMNFDDDSGDYRELHATWFLASQVNVLRHFSKREQIFMLWWNIHNKSRSVVIEVNILSPKRKLSGFTIMVTSYNCFIEVQTTCTRRQNIASVQFQQKLSSSIMCT